MDVDKYQTLRSGWSVVPNQAQNNEEIGNDFSNLNYLEQIDPVRRAEIVDAQAEHIAQVLREVLVNKSVKEKKKTPFFKKRVEMSYKALAIGAGAFLTVAGLATPTVTQMVQTVSTRIEQEKVLSNEEQQFYRNYVEDTIHVNSGQTNSHWHDYKEMINESQIEKIYKDPIVAFYMGLENIDAYCWQDYIQKFNEEYKTNYTNVEDFLVKNHFKDKKEWKAYVASKLLEEKEALLDGSSFNR